MIIVSAILISMNYVIDMLNLSVKEILEFVYKNLYKKETHDGFIKDRYKSCCY